jgi:flagellar FliJ protein
MSHLSPLPMLIELAKKERDAAAQAMATSAREVEAAEKQLTLLRDYRADYARRQEKTMAQGAQALLAQSYRQFIERIDLALAQQERDVERVRGKLTAAQAVLAQAQRRVSSFEALLKRRDAEILLAQTRKEQKQSDEQASQATLRNASGWNQIR